MKRDVTNITLDDLTLKQEAVLRACITEQPRDDYLRAETVTKMCDAFCSLKYSREDPLYIGKNEFNSTIKSLLSKGYLSLFSASGIQTTSKGLTYIEQQQKHYMENYDFDIIAMLDDVAKEIQYVAKHKTGKK
jgi:hypothetical protein